MNDKHQTINVPLGERAYDVLVGQGLLDQNEQFKLLAAQRTVVVVTNTTVAALYLDRVKAQLAPLAAKVIEVVLPDGEEHKTLATLELILSAMLAQKADRKTLIVALGGGVVGDMAGFAAAVYQRGIEFVQIPTTLLSMVDSSIGGKTAVNHPLGKNMIGAFYQPRLVLADVSTLSTLPARELSAGLAEVIKHGAILDRSYLDLIGANMEKMVSRDSDALAAAVAGSCRIKAQVVAEDEREQGVRAHLNFGHTFGHAIEAGMGYGIWLHGEAVGAGMVIAAELSVRMGMLSRADFEHLRLLIAKAGLPVLPPRMTTARMIELMSVDKKASQGIPKFILLESLGRATIRQVPAETVQGLLDDFQGQLS